MPQYPQDDNLFKEHEARCTHCGWERRFTQAISAGLRVGDLLGSVAEDPNFNRCNRCKRQKMLVTKVPEYLTESRTQGFWKVPEK
jgi:hypothetical protein